MLKSLLVRLISESAGVYPKATCLTILSISLIEKARQVMEEKPLVDRKLRTFKRGKWELSLGRIDLSLRRSAGILFGGSLATQERVSAKI
jgi:hypothetical protein